MITYSYNKQKEVYTMSNNMVDKEFADKFSQLSAQNQRYIIAIQQALMFAQTNEKAAKEKCCESEPYVGVLGTK